MNALVWDQAGTKFYELGTDRGVLYLRGSTGAYTQGVAWNGLTAVTKSPTGAESNKHYADNMIWANIISAEEFEGTIECFTYPDEFMQCNGEVEAVPGAVIGQQSRRPFGFSYRSKIGNDIDGQDHAYKIHLIWGASAGVAEVAHSTINDSPEPATLSFPITTEPTPINGVTDDNGDPFKPTATLTLDSRTLSAALLNEIETILYGSPDEEPRLPLPGEIIEILQG